MTRLTITALLVALGAGCTGPACLQPQPYQRAEPFPALDVPPGLNVPEPDPNFAVPDVASGPVGAFPKGQGMGPEQLRCLEMPPRLEPTQG